MALFCRIHYAHATEKKLSNFFDKSWIKVVKCAAKWKECCVCGDPEYEIVTSWGNGDNIYDFHPTYGFHKKCYRKFTDKIQLERAKIRKVKQERVGEMARGEQANVASSAGAVPVATCTDLDNPLLCGDVSAMDDNADYQEAAGDSDGPDSLTDVKVWEAAEQSISPHVNAANAIVNIAGGLRHEGDKTEHHVCPVAIEQHVFSQWCCVGRAEGLKTDTEIAKFLLNQYDKNNTGVQSDASCILCHGLLTLCCISCGYRQMSDSEVAAPTLKVEVKASVEKTASPLQMQEMETPPAAKDSSTNHIFGIVKQEPCLGPETAISKHAFLNPIVHAATLNITSGHMLEGASASEETFQNSADKLGESFNLPIVDDYDNDDDGDVSVVQTEEKHSQDQAMDVHTPSSEIPFLRSRGSVENQENYSCKAKTEEMCMEEVPIFIENIRLPSEFGLRPRGPGLRRGRSHVAEEEREWLPGWKKQNKGFECKVCFERFESSFLLQQHRAIHDSGDTYACNFCDNVFQSKSSFTAHRRKHKGSMQLKCFKQHCSWSFESEDTRKKHMLTHKPPPAFKSCPDCDMLFSNSHSLQDHMGTHVQADVPVAEVQESVSDRSYMCDKCGQSFTCEQSMTDHILKMHQKCVCDVCGDVIHGKSSMNKHMKKHPKAKIYKCHQCKRGFAYQRNLAIHTQKHESQDKLICEHCGKGFFSKHYMKIHIRKHTGEESAFKCNVLHL